MRIRLAAKLVHVAAIVAAASGCGGVTPATASHDDGGTSEGSNPGDSGNPGDDAGMDSTVPEAGNDSGGSGTDATTDGSGGTDGASVSDAQADGGVGPDVYDGGCTPTTCVTTSARADRTRATSDP